jgi:hypothetical protein
MNVQEMTSRCSVSADEFDRHEHRSNGLQVIESICGGLNLLRDAFYSRVHSDVERRMGMDSMIFPISEEKSERTTKLEIEFYQVVVSAAAAEAKGYVVDAGWYRDWLARLRLGEFDDTSRPARRIAYYVSKTATEQRLAFSNILATIMPEASRAPLILLRLLPAAVQIATALAFGKSEDALSWRHEQIEVLPSIVDCHRCRGKLLENGEQCTMCGNPMWTFEWLTTADG